MKKLYRNIAVLTFAAAFLAFGLRGETTNAQTKPAAKPTPTPAKEKKSPAPKTEAKPAPTASPKNAATAKTAGTPKPVAAKTPSKDTKDSSKTAEPKPKPTPAKPQEQGQVIVSVASARVRSEPNMQASTLTYADIGKIFTISDKNESWYKIRLSDSDGWISKTVVSDYAPAQRERIYRQIADKYLQQKSIDFPTAVQVFEFLTRAERETKSADLSLKRLQILRYVLGSIPFDKQRENPFKNFTETYAGEIVYSEPAGQWYIRADKIWELHGEHKNKPAGEEIAWFAAQTNLPGECEGYINCYLYLLRVTDGEYLNFYPNGKYSRQALKNITTYLDPIAADAKAKQVYYAANDLTDRAEFNRLLAELRTIISKLPFVEKQKAIQQINLIGEAHR